MLAWLCKEVSGILVHSVTNSPKKKPDQLVPLIQTQSINICKTAQEIKSLISSDSLIKIYIYHEVKKQIRSLN